MQLIVRTKGTSSAALAQIRRIIHELDPQLPIGPIRSLSSVVDESIARPRLYAQLMGAFAVMAALLALLGLGTVLSHSLQERRRGLAIRAALGATRSRVFTTAIAAGLRPVLTGVLGGILLAMVSARLLRSLLFGIQPLNLPTYLIVIAVFAAGSVLVCAGPAFKAARVDPMRVLRED